MTHRDNPNSTAVQALVWAIEEIVKTGDKEAEHHARLALKHLQSANGPANRPRP
jgi:hypothetical protein